MRWTLLLPSSVHSSVCSLSFSFNGPHGATSQWSEKKTKTKKIQKTKGAIHKKSVGFFKGSGGSSNFYIGQYEGNRGLKKERNKEKFLWMVPEAHVRTIHGDTIHVTKIMWKSDLLSGVTEFWPPWSVYSFGKIFKPVCNWGQHTDNSFDNSPRYSIGCAACNVCVWSGYFSSVCMY